MMVRLVLLERRRVEYGHGAVVDFDRHGDVDPFLDALPVHRVRILKHDQWIAANVVFGKRLLCFKGKVLGCDVGFTVEHDHAAFGIGRHEVGDSPTRVGIATA